MDQTTQLISLFPEGVGRIQLWCFKNLKVYDLLETLRPLFRWLCIFFVFFGAFPGFAKLLSQFCVAYSDHLLPIVVFNGEFRNQSPKIDRSHDQHFPQTPVRNVGLSFVVPPQHKQAVSTILTFSGTYKNW